MNFIRKLFCRHPGICIKTETQLDGPLLLIKSHIKCDFCDKSFAFHPNSPCCHVQHMHSEIMREKFIEFYKTFKQPEIKNNE